MTEGTFCNDARKVTVDYQFGKSYKDKIVLNDPPIQVKTEEFKKEITTTKKCWEFYDTTGAFQLFACCKVAEYRSVQGSVDPSWKGSNTRMCCFCDGILLEGEGWYYGNGYEALREILPSQIQHTARVSIRGNCASCQDFVTQCKITIKNAGGYVFTDSGDCPVKFEVSCDDQCPEGYIKCKTLRHPGYCCISCNEIKAEIQSLTSYVRSITNG